MAAAHHLHARHGLAGSSVAGKGRVPYMGGKYAKRIELTHVLERSQARLKLDTYKPNTRAEAGHLQVT